MKTKKLIQFLLILALLIAAAVLLLRTQPDPAIADGDPGYDMLQTETPTASPTVTNTAEPTETLSPSATPDPQSSPTPSSEPTATLPPPDEGYRSYLPVLADIPPPSPPGCIPETHIPAYSISAEQQLASILNAYRLSKGKPALNVLPHLTQAARRHALDMAENDYLDHIGSDDSSVGERVSDACYQWLHVGQILGSGESVEAMVNSWTLTRDNQGLILSEEYIDFGMAYVYDSDSLYQHYWVVVFGRHQSAGQYNE